MGKRILVVDDEVNIVELLKYNLQKEQYHVYTAESGEEGLAVLKNKPVDMAILDLMLPGIDGLELLKYIRRQNALYSSTPSRTVSMSLTLRILE